MSWQIIAVTRENALLHAVEPKEETSMGPTTYETKSESEKKT
jgi:hypothetical protein